LWVEGLLSNASESFVNTFITPFALGLGATSSQIGTLSSATNVASALGLLPGARLEERYGCRKRIFLLCTGVFGRLFLLALVGMPFFLHSSALFYGVLAVTVGRAFLNQLCYPAWSALITDLVPEEIRGRYFGSRNIGVGFAALVATPLAGYLISGSGIPRGYQFSFAIAAATGFLATAVFAMVREPGPVRGREHCDRPRRAALSALARHPRFAAFTLLGFFWHLSLQAAGPFFSVYQIERLGANVCHIGILTSVGALTGMLGQRVWGAQNDRRGDVWVIRVTGFILPAMPFAWSVIPSWSYLPLVEAASGFIWSGYWLANFNLMVRMAPDGNRARFVAVYQSATAIASFIGPVLGGILVAMISIKGLFWLSAAGRFIVSFLFLFLIPAHRPERTVP
jgi:MFS family permease